MRESLNLAAERARPGRIGVGRTLFGAVRTQGEGFFIFSWGRRQGRTAELEYTPAPYRGR